jgi:methionyl-tRNA synthetase
VERHFGGVVPAPDPTLGTAGVLAETARGVVEGLDDAVTRLDFARALGEIWGLLGVANKYLDEEAPWRTVKTDTKRAGVALANTVEALRVATILLSPWLPTATARVWEQLGIGAPLSQQRLEDARKGALPRGTRVRPGAPIFPRIETAKVEAARPGDAKAVEDEARRSRTQTEAAAVSDSGSISIDEFRKCDIRIAEVLEAKRVPNTDKLIEAKIDLGGEVRTIITGLIPQYQPEELVGKRIVVLANLQPRRVRGVDSHGMLLAAEWEGQVALLTVEKNAPKGARIT